MVSHPHRAVPPRQSGASRRQRPRAADRRQRAGADDRHRVVRHRLSAGRPRRCARFAADQPRQPDHGRRVGRHHGRGRRHVGVRTALSHRRAALAHAAAVPPGADPVAAAGVRQPAWRRDPRRYRRACGRRDRRRIGRRRDPRTVVADRPVAAATLARRDRRGARSRRADRGDSATDRRDAADAARHSADPRAGPAGHRRRAAPPGRRSRGQIPARSARAPVSRCCADGQRRSRRRRKRVARRPRRDRDPADRAQALGRGLCCAPTSPSSNIAATRPTPPRRRPRRCAH